MLRESDAQLLVHAEMQKQNQALSMIIAPVGVGSLTQAIISYYKSPNNASPPLAVMTVEPDTAATLHKSLKVSKSLSIATSPTIMAGLECGTLSSIAWPLLRPGVDISTTISDWECHHAIEYLKKHGVGAGPCGGAALAGLRRLASDPASKGVLNKDSVAVCICTEGTRPYTFPTPVGGEELSLVNALMVLHMTPNIAPGRSMQNVPVSAVLNYVAQWLEYRDVEVSWVEHGSENASLVAKLHSAGEWVGNGERKSLLLISRLPSKTEDKMGTYTGLGAALLATAQLQQSTSMARPNITLAIIPAVAGLRSVLETLGTPDAGLLVDTAAGFDLLNVQDGMNFEFSRTVEQSVRSALGREVALREASSSPVSVLDILKGNNVYAMTLGCLGGNLADDKGDKGEESEYLMAKALIQVAKDWCS